MEFDDIPDQTEDLLDLEEEMMREQGLQYEPMEDDFMEAKPSSTTPPAPQNIASNSISNPSVIQNSVSNPTGSNLKPLASGNNVQSALNAIPQTKAKKLSSDEFTKSIQEERRKALGKDHSLKPQTNVVLENCSKLYVLHDTQLPSVPPIQSVTTESLLAKIKDDSSLACNLQCGERILLADRVKNSHPESTSKSQYMRQLLSRPIEQIIKDYEEAAVQKILSSTASTTAVNTTIDPTPSSKLPTPSKAKTDSTSKSSMLWVDKYAPKSFTQLLSLESTNREVLKAVKRWDKFVFKRDLPAILLNSSTTSTTPNPASKPPATASSNHTSKSKDSEKLPDSVLDSDDRPHKKVILLCGPPGTGKTTLAHVIASHCGYRPLEINASDDRSPEAIHDLLQRATQNETMDADKRPNCIIIDEIDGLDGSNKASLEVLLQVLQAPLQTAASKKANSKGSKTSVKSNRFALTRPLICICNDLYAPALRDLRRFAEIFHFSVPQDLRLVQRLQYICREEKVIPAPSTTLLYELIRATGYDIRSSINSLQFAAFHQSQQKQLRQQNASSASSMESMLESMMKIGLKDDHLDAYQIWTQVFTRARPPPLTATTATTFSTATAGGSSANSERDYQAMIDAELFMLKNGMIFAMDRMLEHSDLPLIIQGLYENLMTIPSYDMTSNHLHRHTYSSEWFSWTNLFSAGIISGSNSNHDYYSQYISLVAGATYYAHATSSSVSSSSGLGSASSSGSKLHIEWPKRDKDAYYQMMQRQNILSNLVGASASSPASTNSTTGVTTLTHISKQRIVLDVISSLIDIIRPKLRSGISLLSYTKEEALLFQEVIEIMDSCGLQYQSTSTHALSEDILAMVNATINTTSNSNGSYPRRSFPTPNKPFEKRGWYPNAAATATEGSVLLLEPNIDLLVTYYDHTPANPDNNNNNDSSSNRSLLAVAPQGWKGYGMKAKKKKLMVLNIHPSFSQELRQLLMMEQRKYAIRRKEARLREVSSHVTIEGVPESKVNITNKSEEEKTITTATSLPVSENAPRHGLGGFFTKRTTDSSINDEDRINKKAKLEPTSTAEAAMKKELKVRYKFNEGFSNAVKRTVYLKDFL